MLGNIWIWSGPQIHLLIIKSRSGGHGGEHVWMAGCRRVCGRCQEVAMLDQRTTEE